MHKLSTKKEINTYQKLETKLIYKIIERMSRKTPLG